MWYIKYLNKYLAWKGKKTISRDTVDEERKTVDKYADMALGNKRIKAYIDQCIQETFEIDGPDGNKIAIYMVKSIANKDRTDLAPVVHFHGGGGYSGHPKQNILITAR